MNDERNPYAAPSSSLESAQPGAQAQTIFLTWEKWLRPSYNVVLVGVSCWVIAGFIKMGYPVPRNGRTLFHFFSRAIEANVLFTAGPIADYLIAKMLGKRFVLVTLAIFALGTLLAMLIVRISVSWFWSTQYPELGWLD
jgi:hypothetical protein